MSRLEELAIRDLGVIEDVTLGLSGGLNVVTGETGAGKTMVVSGLELLLGARADGSRIRAGAASAVVEGRLRPPPSAAEEWLEPADDELIVSREIARDSGRSRARVGGRLAPVSALASTVGSVVELHGQHDTARLVSPAAQRELLDRFGGDDLAALTGAYLEVFEAWNDTQRELSTLRDGERERARELDRLGFELAEVEAVEPEPGEEQDLAERLARLEHADALRSAAAKAARALTGESGARDSLGMAVGALRAVAGLDSRLDGLAGRAEGLLAEAQDLGLELGGYGQDLDHDPGELERLRERQAALAALTWKYVEGSARGAVDASALCDFAERARARIVELRSGDDRVAELESRVAQLGETLVQNAAAVTEGRRLAAERLAVAVDAHLADLSMADAAMRVVIEPVEPGPHGADRVTFALAGGPDEDALPIGRAASGGERSRIALAVRLALADADETPVLVFDEIDAGIGGATALALGRKLAELARGRQVLCVTHLAQLAAFADAHFVVDKQQQGGRTVATVRALDEPGREAELARMLSGTPGSDRAADHAAELRANAVAALAGR